MAQEKPKKLANLVVTVREGAPEVRRRLGHFVDVVRENPRDAWASAGVRYTVYLLGAMIGLALAGYVSNWIAPPGPADARERAETADFHVLCTDPACLNHFVIHEEFGFRKFPVECPKCHKKTGQRAIRCNSPTCQGAWAVPLVTERGLKCPGCGASFPAP
jgi:hypothetical protein